MNVAKAVVAVREFGLGLPEAWEDHPWGESALKVRKKVFVFLGREDGEHMTFTVKLPNSGEDVLMNLPWASETGYGLGKSGWVTFRFPPDDIPDLETLRNWVTESYRAVAPKKLSKLLASC